MLFQSTACSLVTRARFTGGGAARRGSAVEEKREERAKKRKKERGEIARSEWEVGSNPRVPAGAIEFETALNRDMLISRDRQLGRSVLSALRMLDRYTVAPAAPL